MNTTIKAACLVLALFTAPFASALWELVDDSGAINGAINPGPANSAPQGPSSQSAANIATWLDNLLGGGSSFTLIDQGDSTPASLTGLMDSWYVVLHYGNAIGEIGIRANVNIAYQCDGVDCGTFDTYSTQGLSNYRIYGASATVPEPGSLALLAIGLLGLGVARLRIYQ